MIILLLQDDAKRAKNIIDNFKPTFRSKEEYFKYVDALYSEGDRIVYKDNGVAEIRL